ncbi:hypothetical protein GE061_013508 [Apolygus lucorum]|uniref:ANKLE2 third alpha/beta domain-containing protein n=1 Tax=Apolygus lucorum TaxID=248454 RepID=A0A6A4KF26_APOLU|nr:hypothetical protein GE061_013508 [Apolygus lucorum]
MALLQQKDGSGDSDCNHKSSNKENIPSSSTNNGSGDASKIYYGIYIPDATVFESKVYVDRNETLRAMKANKKARFKAFSDERAAIEFSLNGCETDFVKAECPILPSSPTVASDTSTFKGPKSQDLVQFRKGIEKHDFTFVRRCMEENPRYLISSGDTPQILQEGSRYNPLHIAARANNAVVAKYICDTVRSVEFMNRLYGGAHSNLADRGSIMLDLYLNTPDKGLNETPLHFASKLGAIEVVRVLVGYEQCDRQRRNKYGDTAKDLVCSRASGLAADAGIKKEILFALEDQYYVAVLRSPDNALNPTIPEPFCPTSPPPFLEGSTQKKSNEQPMLVSGVAGPMSASDATIFRKKWKTPPRKLTYNSTPASPVVTDPEKGLERVGRALATDFNVQWKEYWAFLGEFLDISSPEGLKKLENHLKIISMNSSKSPLKNTPEKPQAPSESVLSPITDLCNNFKTLDIKDPRPKVSPHCLVHSSTVYATRLALSLTRGLLPSIQEIDKYQYFLEGCSKDSRFSQEDLSTAHSRLATLVYTKLCSSKNDNSDFINSVLSEKTDNCSKRSFDRLKCVLNFVNEVSPGKSVLKSCDCPIRNNDSQNINRFALPDSPCVRTMNSHFNRNGYDLKDEDDSDDDMDEFFTPPSSPLGFEDPDEDEFLAANESPELFIEGGHKPTKVDYDVYRSLTNVIPDLHPSKYPHIYIWSGCLAKHRGENRSETI